MKGQFDKWRAEFRGMIERAEQVAAGLSEDQLHWHPSKDRWSIAQCLDHLNRANGKIAAQLEAGISGAKESGKSVPGDWKPGWLERLFIRMVGPNAPIKSPVPPDFVPADRPDLAALLPTFRDRHDRFLACLDDVERRGLVRVKVASPVLRFVKCTLGTWFAATVEHDSYHLGQAEQARRELDKHLAGAG